MDSLIGFVVLLFVFGLLILRIVGWLLSLGVARAPHRHQVWSATTAAPLLFSIRVRRRLPDDEDKHERFDVETRGYAAVSKGSHLNFEVRVWDVTDGTPAPVAALLDWQQDEDSRCSFIVRTLDCGTAK